jgi:transcriptional regulator with XRE-family HTH domain
MVQVAVLKQVREQRGETVTSMARKLGVGVSRYYMIESGARPATSELVRQIAVILGMKSEALFLPLSFTVRETLKGGAPADASR